MLYFGHFCVEDIVNIHSLLCHKAATMMEGPNLFYVPFNANWQHGLFCHIWVSTQPYPVVTECEAQHGAPGALCQYKFALACVLKGILQRQGLPCANAILMIC